jgi:hypothetical protein
MDETREKNQTPIAIETESYRFELLELESISMNILKKLLTKTDYKEMTIDSPSFHFETKNGTKTANNILAEITEQIIIKDDKKKPAPTANTETQNNNKTAPTEKKKRVLETENVWTKDEDEIIKKFYLSMPAPILRCEKLQHRTPQSIYHRARFLKIRKNKKKSDSKLPLMGKEHLLKRYRAVSIWKPILEYVISNIDDEFKRKDIVKIIKKYYTDVLKRKISDESANAFSSHYLRYMRGDGILPIIEYLPRHKYRKIKPESNASKIKLSKNALDLIELSKQYRWADLGIRISIAWIQKKLNISVDEIKNSLAELIRADLVQQFGPNSVRFKI